MFVAVWPDDATREGILALGLEPKDGVRLVRAADWHVTLRFLGDVDGELVPDLGQALQSAVREVAGPVRCALGPATGWFPGGRVLQLPAAGLDDLAGAVLHATDPLVPEGLRGERFRGHLTLGRSKGRRGLSDAAQAVWAGIGFEGSFDVAAVELVESKAMEGPRRYTTIVRAVLGGCR
jgi:2'-5' RNA ligase